ncbi:hypothetical protein QYE76_062924 [Lolium multiflorum]|uniref:Reverse transcriptase Ty1/copia-type domain-containing protein n=1 Tax=Lolium multiflorum TaxID=4521 RepID=A0AAD8S3Z0_LOLMU|nr:hypothetical protein QYE76_062924 [Lolium multiflorum]
MAEEIAALERTGTLDLVSPPSGVRPITCPRAWFERFASVVRFGFSPSLHDPALFVHTSPRGRTLLLLYVDDMIITGDDPEYIAFVKARLRDQFLMTDLGPLRYFLGIEVSSTSDGFSISREKYIQDLLARAALGDERTVDTPMELNVKLRPTDGDPLPDHPLRYRSDAVSPGKWIVVTEPRVNAGHPANLGHGLRERLPTFFLQLESQDIYALAVPPAMEHLLIKKYKLKNNDPPVKVALYMGERCEHKV